MDRKIVLITSVVLVSLGLLALFFYAPPKKAPVSVEEETVLPTLMPTLAPKTTAKPLTSPTLKPAKTSGDFFILTPTKVMEITFDKKVLREFPFAAYSAQRLANGMTLFAGGSEVFEADEDGKVFWKFEDESMNATYAWKREDGITVVADANGRILKITPAAEINWQIKLPEGSRPLSAFPLEGDDVLVADAGLSKVQWIEMDKDGVVFWEYGKYSPGFSHQQLNGSSFAVDVNQQSVLVADTGNNRLLEIPYSTQNPTWEVNHVPSPQSIFFLNNNRLTTSKRGVELIYQNRTFDWKWEGEAFRAFPVSGALEVKAEPSALTAFVTRIIREVGELFRGA